MGLGGIGLGRKPWGPTRARMGAQCHIARCSLPAAYSVAEGNSEGLYCADHRAGRQVIFSWESLGANEYLVKKHVPGIGEIEWRVQVGSTREVWQLLDEHGNVRTTEELSFPEGGYVPDSSTTSADGRVYSSTELVSGPDANDQRRIMNELGLRPPDPGRRKATASPSRSSEEQLTTQRSGPSATRAPHPWWKFWA
jgi:hypothetical protein